MVKRKLTGKAPYEGALEELMIRNRVTYLAINEGKQPIGPSKEKIKNFDFLVFAENRILLVDVKGKKFPYEPPTQFSQ